MRVNDLDAARHAQTPGVPRSTTHVLGPTQLRYCVRSYAPSSPVSVAEPNGDTVSIHTNNVGAACTVLPYDVVCGGAGRAVVATGVGADGNPATSSATPATLARPATCAPTPSAHAAAGGGLSTASTVLIVVAAVVVAGGLALALLLRRRRAAEG
ncbi:MAG TPA: hypothetical protein VG899_04875 [Mycobacteriales bacterium]|nr:hypothetical protein [Mycobacteriales bacterium]